MKHEQVDQALCKKFIEEKQRIVFWHDPKSEFGSYLLGGLPAELNEADVKVLNVAHVGGLAAKLLLEREDPDSKYLVYSTGELPPVDEDWLLDIRQYSSEFHADLPSLWRQELGLTSLHLRDHLLARGKFLVNRERLNKLKQLVGAGDDETTIDLKMMAVLTGSDVADLFSVLRAMCQGHLDDGLFELDRTPAVLTQMEKMGLASSFWAQVQKYFDYQDVKPTLGSILRRLFVTELASLADSGAMASVSQFVLSAKGRSNAKVFLTQWRDSTTYSVSYDAVAEIISKELKFDDLIGDFPLEALGGIFLSWEVELRVVSKLKARVLEERSSVSLAEIEQLVSMRKAGHWLNGPAKDLPERQAAADAYDAIVAAARLFVLCSEHKERMTFESPQALLSAYKEELFLFDQHYRSFCAGMRRTLLQGWDLLKTLGNEVEKAYDQEFLQPLGLEWGRHLDHGFLETWRLPEFPAQQEFYDNQIRPYLSQSERKRVYVIISDALRYEVAHQLTSALNGRYRMDASLDAMLGVLPSYTKLGMASLLPHEELRYRDDGTLLVDGGLVGDTKSRNTHLAGFEGMACLAKDLRLMKQQEARDFTRGKRVVYIYHNVIDDRLDADSRETGSMVAVEDCVAELLELAQFCMNKLSAGTVWMTSDHGFVFQRVSPDQTDRSALVHKPSSAVKANKRYFLGRDLGVTKKAHCGTTRVTAGTNDDMEFWVPRGTNRFYFTGGARFFHGGAMPQEVVVPLITIRKLRGKHKIGSRSAKVSVQVIGQNHKITTPKYRFELIQTSAVDERLKPITVKAAVYDGLQPVTSVATVAFDSSSKQHQEWKRSILLELSAGEYDKARPYRLVLRDAETEAEVQSIPVVIDRSFDDDF